jgi:hypothetical protein
VAGDGEAAFVDGGVVPLTQQDQIRQVGAAAQDPRHQVVGFQVPGLMAARILTHAVPWSREPVKSFV